MVRNVFDFLGWKFVEFLFRFLFIRLRFSKMYDWWGFGDVIG